jgi:CheY-like chemotaxis protein
VDTTGGVAGVKEGGEPRPRTAGTRILVVEDNRDAADSLRLLLELYGYEATVAYTGPDGVKAAERWRPDVVLCDLGLPGLDGYGVARKLRGNPATAKVRLIAVTAYGWDEDHRRSHEAGFERHLVKPVDPGSLRGVLDCPAVRNRKSGSAPLRGPTDADGFANPRGDDLQPPRPRHRLVAAGRVNQQAGVQSMEKVNVLEKFARFTAQWKPKVVGELNGQQVKLVKFRGPFVWHRHDLEDELSLVVKGRFRMEFRGRHVWLGEGEFLVVPRGVEHRPVANEEAHVLLFEPAGTLNTGNVRNERTVADLERI